MLKELWVTIHVYLLKGNPFTMDVGRVGWPLVQMGCFRPKAGQLPQKRPGPQSVAAEHASRTWQLALEQVAEAVKEREQMSGTKRSVMTGAGALHLAQCDHMATLLHNLEGGPAELRGSNLQAKHGI